MAWNLLPIAFGAVKTYIDEQNAKSADKAQAAAGAEKLRLMREGAHQVSDYRQQLTPQMLQAMKNQMGAYGGARSVLSQMYGGGGSGQASPQPGAGPLSNQASMGGGAFGVSQAVQPSVLRSMTPAGAQQGQPAIAGRGGVFQPETLRRMGFGGEQAPVRGRMG